ncbi:MAG: 4Fe-4S dicluster domain-containing protein [Deltaproteobacteria bacterium]|nr:4Fe-4S dicluster domain-containing protein [Deltaproteobacteria bacterium]
MTATGERSTAPAERSLLAAVRSATGLDPSHCYQCGKCSAGCPMADEMDLKTHEIIRLLQLDRRERLLSSQAIWLCLTCETCTARCPNEFDPAATIDALREIVLAESASKVPRPMAAFHGAFLDQIRAHGRVFEFGLVASYKLRGGALFADVAAAPGMLLRGKLSLMPERIAGVADIRRIFERCQTAREPK